MQRALARAKAPIWVETNSPDLLLTRWTLKVDLNAKVPSHSVLSDRAIV